MQQPGVSLNTAPLAPRFLIGRSSISDSAPLCLDGQTDRFAISISRISVLTHDKHVTLK